MPGSGKSTIGRILAQCIGYDFLDLDAHIALKEGEKVSDILVARGDAALSQLEEKYALEVPLHKTVFSPGGSIVYSPRAMKRIQKQTKVIFLDVPVSEISERIKNTPERGIIGLRARSLEELYQERLPLYQAYADYTVCVTRLTEQEVIEAVCQLM